MKFELARRTPLLNPYIIVGLVIILLSSILIHRTTGANAGFDSIDVVLLFVVLFLLIFAFKMLPNLPLKKHIRIGYIDLHHNYISIEDSSGIKKIHLDSSTELTVRLLGYDGQHVFGDNNSLGNGNSSSYPDIRPMNGLKNYIRIRSKDSMLRYELYISTKNDYEKLTELVKYWSMTFDKVKSEVIR